MLFTNLYDQSIKNPATASTSTCRFIFIELEICYNIQEKVIALIILCMGVGKGIKQGGENIGGELRPEPDM